MESLYAKSLLNLHAKGLGEETLVKNLIAHLKQVGRMKLLPSILRELKREQARNETTEAVVEVAHKDEASEALKEAQAAGSSATKTVVNDTLLSGWRAREKGIVIDRSGKRALIDLYARIVKH